MIVQANNAETTTQVIPLFIEKAREGTYFTVPFILPVDVESLTLSYHYERHHNASVPVGAGNFVGRTQINIIDLGLIAPDGTQLGASGSDKSEFYLSETKATPGYKPHALTAGEWQILVGVYKVAPEGVQVTYEIKTTCKTLRLLKGDLHMHTLASDGVQTAAELAYRALRNGLDFVAITDHNQMVAAEALPDVAGITLIPGIEWTHYKGHANFLGSAQPYDGSFMANTPAEVQARFDAARQRGATIVINHPFDEGSPFQFELGALPFDLLEVWNGPMRESNLKAVGYWQQLLTAGKKIPICGGSDYHRDTPFIFLGGPTTCVYALSCAPSDILSALRAGHAYITFAPNGPVLEMRAGEAMLGDSVAWDKVKDLTIHLENLLAGDVVRVVTANTATVVLQAPASGRFNLIHTMPAPGFARVEVLRAFLPGLPLLPALLSNPVYFN